MPPVTDKDEAQTRIEIDAKLESAGWVVQNMQDINLIASEGVALREVTVSNGRADYLLFISGKLCGSLEAKREGTNLGGVSEQNADYIKSSTGVFQRWVPKNKPLPFQYEATNNEIRFCDHRDPKPRSRHIFHFHRPETLKERLDEGSSFRARLQTLPELNTKDLRACQIDAIKGIEKSLKNNNQRALLQMATGAGKTFTACTQVYRLAKFAEAKRVLFLVDRGNLGRQALKEFQQYTLPDDGRKFTSLYNAQVLGTAGIADGTKVVISTIQRMYCQLTGNELGDEIEEHSSYEVGYDASSSNQEVTYNPHIPIEAFDLIIIDECHRSIYNLWSQVLDYFDAFLIGLTATPTKKTVGYFHQNVVSEYSHEDAVIDRVNVGYDIYRIKTEKTEQGGLLEAGTNIEIRDRLTKQKRWQLLDEDEVYDKKKLDRSVIAPNQIRTVIQTFKERCLPECFPNREWIPKTLFFAKDDDHADRIVDTIRDVFGEDNSFCKKVTYKVGKKQAEDTIAEFRTSPRLRIAVTVDMIATGTDIKPLECVVFMRDVRSQAYYEQMKGRGTRVIGDDVLKKVTPDAPTKTRFVLVDAVGVTESDKTETKSMEHKPSVSTEKLMQQVAMGDRSPETLETLGNRFIRLDAKLDENQREQFTRLAGKPLALIAGELIHAANEDRVIALAREEDPELEELFANDAVMPLHNPDVRRKIEISRKEAANAAVQPIHKEEMRKMVESLRRKTDQLIDDSADELMEAGYDEEKAKGLVKRYQEFIADHQDELAAIQLIYSKPYKQRHLNYEQIEDLAEQIKQPPYNIAPLSVWKAYEQLVKNKVKGVPAKELLTNIVSLIRFSTGLSDVLEPFPALVNERFTTWLDQQEKQKEDQAALSGGVKAFSPQQKEWLNLIKDQIANNAEFEMDDFDYIPACKKQGGLLKAQALFGKELNTIVQELNGYLIA